MLIWIAENVENRHYFLYSLRKKRKKIVIIDLFTVKILVKGGTVMGRKGENIYKRKDKRRKGQSGV